MASGITVEENCMEKFMALKQKGSKKMYNFIAMRINSGLTKIEVFEVGGLDTCYDDVYQLLVKANQENTCCYVLLDHKYELAGNPKDKVILISWAPDTAKTKPKMLHSSSLHGLQKALQCESVPVLQCNDLDDIDLETVTKLACKHQRD